MKVIDLFCGCGGLSYGFDYLEQFELIYALDKWKVACQSYKANFPSADIDCRDALTVHPSEIPNCDIILGGPPCQEFSIGKEKRRSYDMSLIDWFLEVIRASKPKFWIMENVPSVLSLISGNFKKQIYCMNEYGVPQLRKRLFAGCFNEPRKYPTSIKFPAVVATEYKGNPGKRKGCRLYSAFRRKSLIPEAKLVQTFPLDFIVLGNLQDQYIQIGNAVSPLMSYRLAEAIFNPSQLKLGR